MELSLLGPPLKLPFWQLYHGRISHTNKSGYHHFCKTMHEITAWRKVSKISGVSQVPKKLQGGNKGGVGDHIVNINGRM